MSRSSATKMAEAFDRKHGKPIREGVYFLYGDGSFRDVDPLGVQFDADQGKRQDIDRNIKRYWQIRLEESRRGFDRLRAEYLDMATHGMSLSEGIGVAPPESVEVAKGKLSQLKEDVLLCQSKLDEVEEQEESSKTPFQKERDQQCSDNQEANRIFHEAVSGIRI